jgi:hypothetical protein
MTMLLRRGVLTIKAQSDASLCEWLDAHSGQVFRLRPNKHGALVFHSLGPEEEACCVPLNITSHSPMPLRLISNFAQTPFVLDSVRTGVRRRDRLAFAAVGTAARALWRSRSDRALARLSRDVPSALSDGAGAENVGVGGEMQYHTLETTPAAPEIGDCAGRGSKGSSATPKSWAQESYQAAKTVAYAPALLAGCQSGRRIVTLPAHSALCHDPRWIGLWA